MEESVYPEYGLWPLVVLNLALFVGFAVSFFKPRTRTDWRTLGAFSAFLLALFTEMYGFPLTLYLLWSWLGNRLPGLDPLSHNSGHLWQVLLGWQGDPHFNVLHVVSNLLVIGGFALIASGWKALHRAVREGRLATGGPYRWVRHPQYAGFVLVMVGFLVQWPTILTLLMFPVLVVMYVRLARREERALNEQFGEAYQQYAARTPAFIPNPASLGRGLRAAILAVLAAATVGGGIWLSLPRTPARSGDADRELILTMAGFTPRQLDLRAGQPTRLRLVNPDSPYHADGGGVHGFTVPDLAIDVEVPPRSVVEIELPAAPPGEYRFYCDTCCGGKDNPSMWGVLRVGA